MTRKRDEQCYKNFTAHWQWDTQVSPILGTLSVNTMKDCNYKHLLNNMYMGAPIAKSQKPTSPGRKPLFSNLILTLKKVPSNMS